MKVKELDWVSENSCTYADILFMNVIFARYIISEDDLGYYLLQVMFLDGGESPTRELLGTFINIDSAKQEAQSSIIIVDSY